MIRTEFKNLFDQFNFDVTREKILNREMVDCSFTTVLWRVFLDCLPRDANQWNEMLEKSRHNYDKLIQQYTIDPHQISEDNQYVQASDHPLSHDEDVFESEFIRKIIHFRLFLEFMGKISQR